MDIHESAENYLETILIIGQKRSGVRSVDIVNELEFSRASVSVAMKKLRESGYIDINGAGHIILTESGREIAEETYERHTLLTDFLTRIGVDLITAANDACRIEHVISHESFEKIRELMTKGFDIK